MRTTLALIVALLVAAPAPGQPATTAGSDQPAAAASPAQEASFAVFLQGYPAGTERVAVVQAADGGWVITSSGRIVPPLDITVRSAEVRYDSAWRALGIRVEGVVGDRLMDVTTTVDGETASSSYLQEGQRLEKADTITRDALLLTNNVFGAYAALAVRLENARAGDTLRAYVAPLAEIGIRVESVSNERLQTARRSFEIRRVRFTMELPDEPLPAEVWLEPGGAFVRLTLAGAIDVLREDVAVVSARQQSFVRDGDQDVRIQAAGFSIAATVSRPPGVVPSRRPDRRLPAVILVPGSGPADRDLVVSGTPVFGHLASDLADAGFLVVRYDKRGVGQSGGRIESATVDDFAEDVRSIVRYLRRQRDVDSRRIFVVGHGEGAWVALLAASREKQIARVALLAGAGSRGADVVIEQQRQVLRKLTLSDEERNARVDLQGRINAAVVGAGSWDGIPDLVRRQAETQWFRSYLEFDPARVMSRVRQPVLVVAAADDAQFGAHHGETLVSLANARKRNPGVELVTLPGVTHHFVPSTVGGIAGESSAEGAARVVPQLAERVAGWLSGR